MEFLITLHFRPIPTFTSLRIMFLSFWLLEGLKESCKTGI